VVGHAAGTALDLALQDTFLGLRYVSRSIRDKTANVCFPRSYLNIISQILLGI
jgi:hypothetical protein